jgi:N6-L-threonylcarbamoyladenine synthase
MRMAPEVDTGCHATAVGKARAPPYIEAMLVLGIETSCDETAAAIVNDDREILADVVLSQTAEHAPYGGVVPEIAARSHVTHLDGLIEQAMAEAGARWADLDAVAVTAGPGLIGGVIVGLMEAKAIAAVHDLPLVAVNHLEGHALTARLTHGVDFPYLLLLISGGHCQLLIVEDVGDYRRLGTTIDDAVGEAFDKTAKLLGLGFPGGPAVEKAASWGAADRFDLPRPLLGREGCDFSFSGLKTAVRHTLESLHKVHAHDRADLAASFQQAVADTLADRVSHAVRMFHGQHPGGDTLVIAGGVAANRAIRERLEEVALAYRMTLIAPPPRLCTDNAAMIAWAGLERLRLGKTDSLTVPARARWPLDPAAARVPFAGVKA